jgi:transposase
MAQMTVFTGPERRRRWSEDDRRRILAAAFSPGVVVSEVARQYDVSTALIYKWRQEARGLAVRFAPVVVDSEPMVRPAPVEAPGIVVDLADGSRVSIGAGVSPALAAAALRALRP